MMNVSNIKSDWNKLLFDATSMANTFAVRDEYLKLGEPRFEKVNMKQALSGTPAGWGNTLEFDLPVSQYGFLDENKLYLTVAALTGGTASWGNFIGLHMIDQIIVKPQNQQSVVKFGYQSYERAILHYGSDELAVHGRNLGGYEILSESQTNSASARTFVISLSKIYNVLGGYFDLCNYKGIITIQVKIQPWTANIFNRGVYAAGGAITDAYLMMATKIPKDPKPISMMKEINYSKGIMYKDFDVVESKFSVTTSTTLPTTQAFYITNLGSKKVVMMTFHVISTADSIGIGPNYTNFRQITSWSLKAGSLRIDGNQDDTTETVYLSQIMTDIYKCDGKKNISYGYRACHDGTNSTDGLTNSDTTRIRPNIYVIAWDNDIDTVWNRNMEGIPGYIDMQAYGNTNINLNLTIAPTTGTTACTVFVNAYCMSAYEHKNGYLRMFPEV